MLLVRGALCGQKNELAAWRWKAPRRWHFHHDQEGSFDLTGTQMRRLDHVLHVLRQSWCRWHYNKWSLEKRRDATALPYHSDHLHWIRSKAADSKDYLQVLTGAFVSPACFRRARRSCIVLSVLTRLWSQIKITFFGIVQQNALHAPRLLLLARSPFPVDELQPVQRRMAWPVSPFLAPFNDQILAWFVEVRRIVLADRWRR